jgi:hypothetical protein
MRYAAAIPALSSIACRRDRRQQIFNASTCQKRRPLFVLREQKVVSIRRGRDQAARMVTPSNRERLVSGGQDLTESPDNASFTDVFARAPLFRRISSRPHERRDVLHHPRSRVGQGRQGHAAPRSAGDLQLADALEANWPARLPVAQIPRAARFVGFPANNRG